MKKSRLFAIYFLQYVPVLATLFMTLHCGLLLLGIHSHIAENATGFSVLGCIMLITFSYVFQFCWLHRCFIIYPTIVELCINFKPLGIFEGWLVEARWVMFLLGCAPIVYLFTHFRKYHHCYENKNKTKKAQP